MFIETAAQARTLFPVYRAERRRLLSNAVVMGFCARKYGRSGYASARKADQRALAALRRNWTPVRVLLAEACA